MANIVKRTIYGQVFSFDKDLIDEDIIKSAKMWLSIREPKNRKFCPFIMKHIRCKDICGKIFSSARLKEKTCAKDVFSQDLMHRFVKEIISVYNELDENTIVDAFG